MAAAFAVIGGGVITLAIVVIEHKVFAFVTHDVREALRLGTRIALLDRGKLEILATPQEFLRSRTPQTRAFLDVLEL